MELGCRLPGSLDARAAVLAEGDALDRPLALTAELSVTEVATEAFVLGALQRGYGAPLGAPVVRRVSGGALIEVGPGTLHIVLALAHVSAIFPCDAARLTNRYVRPLLRALKKNGAPAAYFGRDWISVNHRPVGAVGFAHDSRTGRAVFEAFVAVRVPFSVARPSFLGKEPGTLEALSGRAFDSSRMARSIADAYVAAAGGSGKELPALVASAAMPSDTALRAERPWTSRIEEVIGPVCAGRDAEGVLRLGGEFMASRDAVAQVEVRVAALGPGAAREAVGTLVNDAFTLGGAAIFGVRDLASVRDALWSAQNLT